MNYSVREPTPAVGSDTGYGWSSQRNQDGATGGGSVELLGGQG